MLKILRYVAVAGTVAGVLCGCEQPDVQSIRVYALEDQPKVISADIKTSSNMETPGVRIERIAPALGAVPSLDMHFTSTNGGAAVYEATAPLTPEFAPLAYGTKWQATVYAPYRVLWQKAGVSKSVEFVVGAAKSCSSFDGELQRQGWGEEMRLRQVPERTPANTLSIPTNWLPNENARPSQVTGALGVTITDPLTPNSPVSWVGEFSAGNAVYALSHGSGVRLAVKASRSVQMHLAVHALGVDNGAPNYGWTYSSSKTVEEGGWQIVELPFPTLPPPNSSAPVTANILTVNVANLISGMEIMIDDVCPMP
jgi:hypothetical protein